jgi:hypothetical protein
MKYKSHSSRMVAASTAIEKGATEYQTMNAAHLSSWSVFNTFNNRFADKQI